MPHARVNGIDIYFETHGTRGEPLVLVHGYTGDVTDWRHQLPEFARTHRVLVMDHRGHGKSHAPKERETYNVFQMTNDLEALIAHVCFERYHLVGHSMGGAISQEIALRSPGRLLSLTLEDTGHTFDFGRNQVVLSYLERRYRIADEEGMAAVAAMPGLPPPPHSTQERRDEEKVRMTAMSVDGFVGAWRGLTSWTGTAGRAHAISAPTLVICGELDRGLLEPSRWLAETIAGAQLEIIPEAGHSPQFERPPLFNAALRQHLDRNAGASAK